MAPNISRTELAMVPLPHTWKHSKQSCNKISSIKVRKLFHRTSAHTPHCACDVLNRFVPAKRLRAFDSHDVRWRRLVFVCVWLQGKLLAFNVINDLRHVLPILLLVYSILLGWPASEAIALLYTDNRFINTTTNSLCKIADSTGAVESIAGLAHLHYHNHHHLFRWLIGRIDETSVSIRCHAPRTAHTIENGERKRNQTRGIAFIGPNNISSDMFWTAKIYKAVEISRFNHRHTDLNNNFWCMVFQFFFYLYFTIVYRQNWCWTQQNGNGWHWALSNGTQHQLNTMD